MNSKHPLAVLSGAFLIFCACIGKVQGGYQPPQGFVPDAKTAIRIAVAVWSPIYGEKQIQSEKPFYASLSRGVWTVTGSLPLLPGHVMQHGGTAIAKISKKDGHVLLVTHGM